MILVSKIQMPKIEGSNEICAKSYHLSLVDSDSVR